MDVRIPAAVTGATGAGMLLLRWTAYPALLPGLHETAAAAGLLPVVWIAFAFVVPLFKIWAAIGLAFRFRGGRALACAVLAADVLGTVAVVVRLGGAVALPGEIPWEAPGAAVVRVVEAGPSAIVAAISLATLLVLVRRPGSVRPRPAH